MIELMIDKLIEQKATILRVELLHKMMAKKLNESLILALLTQVTLSESDYRSCFEYAIHFNYSLTLGLYFFERIDTVSCDFLSRFVSYRNKSYEVVFADLLAKTFLAGDVSADDILERLILSSFSDSSIELILSRVKFVDERRLENALDKKYSPMLCKKITSKIRCVSVSCLNCALDHHVSEELFLELVDKLENLPRYRRRGIPLDKVMELYFILSKLQ